ncbi:hypothetical protein F4777DRAFT_276937 [Nemania sp. FL0916]|nr:hypothetical protein F4777DRAFT_276937 [Nemania sp. FL0916]
MSGGWKDVVKNGWHPEKNGTSLRNQVKGLVGRGETPSDREAHIAAPISSLRDPSSFGPPPKHVAAYGPTASPSSPRVATPVAAGRTQSPAQPYSSSSQQQQPAYVDEAPPAEPKPYRTDTTGLSTSHLPPPPARHNGADRRTTTPARSPVPAPAAQIPATTKPRVPPSLPPRLPPRSGNSTPSPTLAGGQAVNLGHLNQGAVNRLGAAGISVPGLGIGGGGSTPPPPPAARPSPPLAGSPTKAPDHGHLSELQARFARMGASSGFQANSNGTTVGDAQQPPATQVPSVLGKKKPPPPPIPKKQGLSVARESVDTPPPIPLATRPKFD